MHAGWQEAPQSWFPVSVAPDVEGVGRDMKARKAELSAREPGSLSQDAQDEFCRLVDSPKEPRAGYAVRQGPADRAEVQMWAQC